MHASHLSFISFSNLTMHVITLEKLILILNSISPQTISLFQQQIIVLQETHSQAQRFLTCLLSPALVSNSMTP